MNDLITRFLEGGPFAVVGASADRAKFGNKVLRCLMDDGRTVFPVHPKADEVEGLEAHASLLELPDAAPHVSVVTPPQVTEAVVKDAIRAGVEVLWLQPGAESATAIEAAREAGIGVIHGGPCLLVELPRV